MITLLRFFEAATTLNIKGGSIGKDELSASIEMGLPCWFLRRLKTLSTLLVVLVLSCGSHRPLGITREE